MSDFKQLADLAGVAYWHADCCSSTNSELIAAIHHKHAFDRAVIYTAGKQTGGRGQYGRSWLSPTGNVYLSFYVPIGQADGQLRCLSGALALCVGLALQQMPIIAALNAERQQYRLPIIGTKWVNDLGFYDANHQFCKLAGILIEPVMPIAGHKIAGAVIGVGVNVDSTPVITDGLYRAISLKDCLPVAQAFIVPSANQLYLPISLAIMKAIAWHNDFEMGLTGGVQLSTDFLAKFNQVHTLHNQSIAIYEQMASTPSHVGICQGVAADGSLLLSQDGKMQAIWAGMAMRI